MSRHPYESLRIRGLSASRRASCFHLLDSRDPEEPSKEKGRIQKDREKILLRAGDSRVRQSDETLWNLTNPLENTRHCGHLRQAIIPRNSVNEETSLKRGQDFRNIKDNISSSSIFASKICRTFLNSRKVHFVEVARNEGSEICNWNFHDRKGRLRTSGSYDSFRRVIRRNKLNEEDERMVCKIRAIFGISRGIVTWALFSATLCLIVIQISRRSVSDCSAYTYVSQR